MEYKIEFDEIPPNLNKIIGMCKSSWFLYSKQKSYWKEIVRSKTHHIGKITNPVDIEMTLTFPTSRRRDKDNYLACMKFILDGLSCLVDDSSKYVKDVTLKDFRYEKGVTKCEIIIKEVT